MCNINYYRFTKEKTVFVNNTDVNDEFDEFILKYNHAPVKMKRVNDTEVARIITGVSDQNEGNGDKPNSLPCTYCGRLHRYWTSLYRHMDKSDCSMSKLTYKTVNKVIDPVMQVGTDQVKDNQSTEYFEDNDEDRKLDNIEDIDSRQK